MSDIIEFMDYTTLASVLGVVNQQVSGMTAAEAEAALGALKNSGLYIANTTSGVLGSNVINFPGTTAAEAAGEYIAGGGATAASGAAIGTTGDAVATANIAIGQSTIGQAATTVYGVLSMPLPTVAAALAPLAGVAIGAGLYNLNPEFWTKVSQTLLPFCYDDSELMPVMADEQGNTYYSKEAIDALTNLLGSISTTGVVPDNNVLNVPSFTYIIDSSFSVTRGSTGAKFDFISNKSCSINSRAYTADNIGVIILYASTDSDVVIQRYSNGSPLGQYPLNLNWTYNGKTVYYQFYSEYSDGSFSTLPLNNYNSGYDAYQKMAWISVYGDNNISGEEGIMPWNGNSYPDTVTPINILTGYDEEGKPIYTPYYPVSTPIGDPGVSNDPAVNPNPAVNPDPAPVINPVISPVPNPNLYPDTVTVPEPAPVPNPVPAEQPVPEPDVDPSEDTDIKPDKDPTTPKDPTDGGTTPTPVIPTIPTLPSAATGLLHVYNPTQSQIDAFGSWLWNTFSGDLIDTLSKLFNDPMDAVIGLHELYATPAVSGGATIRCGYLDSGISANLVGSRYTTINCGSVVVEEYYQNYLDYSPYTSCFIYLPFVGIVPVSSDDIIGNAVNITYHIDSYTGCCIAVVTVAKSGYSSTVYQFEGNCAVEIPISSGYQSSLMSGLLAVAGTAITSSPAIGMTAAHMGRAGLGKNTVQHSGSFGSSYGAMGNKVPYIIVKRPVQKKVYNYSKSYGFPAHKMVYVGNCQGYLRAKEVRVTSTTATNVEKDMIVNALTSGVYVK